MAKTRRGADVELGSPRGSLVWLALCVVFTFGCSDGRPREQEATRWFADRYPNAEVVSVKNNEDEVLAVTYQFDYRTPERTEVRTIRVQFMKLDGANWVPSPASPDTLP